MPPTYSEYLKSLGASEEEVKVLDTPVARKAFDAMNAATAEANEAKEKAVAHYQTLDKWYNEETLPNYKKMEKEKMAAIAEAERAKALVRAATDEGLLQIAKDMGYSEDTKDKEKEKEHTNLDERYVTRDTLNELTERAGAGLADLEDMVIEHNQLFGGDSSKRLRVGELRREAVAARKPILQYWEEKFHVADARAAKEKAEHDAEVAKWKAEGAKEKETELVSKYGNPDTRPLVTSEHPFTPRKEGNRAGKQPWEMEEGSLSSDRVRRATEHVIAQATGKAN
jgi:hypothetical protein